MNFLELLLHLFQSWLAAGIVFLAAGGFETGRRDIFMWGGVGMLLGVTALCFSFAQGGD